MIKYGRIKIISQRHCNIWTKQHCGAFLNYLLVPIYAAAMSAASGGYGVVTEVYAWTALLMVILTYGMETTFFRFVNKETENSERVYSTVLFMVGSTFFEFLPLCVCCFFIRLPA